MNLVKQQDTKLMHRNITHSYTLMMKNLKEKLRKHSHLPLQQKRIKYLGIGASLVAQWLRICLPMQGTRVQALVWEDPTCRGATRPVSHNY